MTRIRVFTERVGYARGVDQRMDFRTWSMVASGRSLTIYEFYFFTLKLAVEVGSPN